MSNYFRRLKRLGILTIFSILLLVLILPFAEICHGHSETDSEQAQAQALWVKAREQFRKSQDPEALATLKTLKDRYESVSMGESERYYGEAADHLILKLKCKSAPGPKPRTKEIIPYVLDATKAKNRELLNEVAPCMFSLENPNLEFSSVEPNDKVINWLLKISDDIDWKTRKEIKVSNGVMLNFGSKEEPKDNERYSFEFIKRESGWFWTYFGDTDLP